MEIEKKYDELLSLLSGYVAGRVSNTELQSFAWDVIEFYSTTPVNELPPLKSMEKPFWYTVWQIQHLCDDAHEDDGVVKNEMMQALAYMSGEAEIPEKYIGLRP